MRRFLPSALVVGLLAAGCTDHNPVAPSSSLIWPSDHAGLLATLTLPR